MITTSRCGAHLYHPIHQLWPQAIEPSKKLKPKRNEIQSVHLSHALYAMPCAIDRLGLESKGSADLGCVGSVDGLLGLSAAAELDGVELETDRGLDAWAEGLGVADGEESASVDLCLCERAHQRQSQT